MILPINHPDAIPTVKRAFDSGDLFVLPTETVYGVACHPFNEESIARIYEVKQRPATKALQIMLSDIEHTERIATHFPDAARKLADAFLPGALSITLPKQDTLPDIISQYPTIAIRIPDHDGLRAIIRALGGMIAITSANVSGGESPTNVQMAVDALGDGVAVYIDDGETRERLSSTVVETTVGNTVKILREGPITQAQIDIVLN